MNCFGGFYFLHNKYIDDVYTVGLDIVKCQWKNSVMDAYVIIIIGVITIGFILNIEYQHYVHGMQNFEKIENRPVRPSRLFTPVLGNTLMMWVLTRRQILTIAYSVYAYYLYITCNICTRRENIIICMQNWH